MREATLSPLPLGAAAPAEPPAGCSQGQVPAAQGLYCVPWFSCFDTLYFLPDVLALSMQTCPGLRLGQWLVARSLFAGVPTLGHGHQSPRLDRPWAACSRPRRPQDGRRLAVG